MNRFLTVLRCICERGNALLKSGWRYLRRVTCCPQRITQIARAALVLTSRFRRRSDLGLLTAWEKCS